MTQPNVRGRRFAVIGGGRSGIAVSRLLVKHGAVPFLSEHAPADGKQEERQALDRLGVEAEFGGHTGRVLEADTIVLSPGVPETIPVIRQAAERKIPVVSEIEIAAWFCPAPIIAVTGTNGKTTTTTLAGRILADAGAGVKVGGNIGVAFSEVVDAIGPGDIAVVEVSSFQLDTVRTFRPKVSVILNITPDHLDRYGGSFERYLRSKGRIMMNQGEGDSVVYNADDPGVGGLIADAVPAGVRQLAFSRSPLPGDGADVRGDRLGITIGGRRTEIMPVSELGIRGIHNLMNAMAAVLAVQDFAVRPDSLRRTLTEFRGVEHRLEHVRDLNGVAYVNDSKATNVESVWYAIQSFSAPLVLLLGGRDKGNDYGRLKDLVAGHVRSIVAIGESAERVEDAFSGVVPVSRAGSMKDAVMRASEAAQRGDIVLLSPACASFDWFDNYEHRGRVFKEEVMRL